MTSNDKERAAYMAGNTELAAALAAQADLEAENEAYQETIAKLLGRVDTALETIKEMQESLGDLYDELDDLK